MANITVTNLNDSGAGSLRAALGTANANADADTITFAAGLSGGTLRLTSGELSITSDVTIDGDANGDNRADIVITGDKNGDDVTTSDSFGNTITNALTNTNTSDNSRVFYVSGSATDASLLNLVVTGGAAITYTGGYTDYGGGGVHVNYGASLTLGHASIAGNVASYGGGISNRNSVLTISDSTIADNVAGGRGGGIYSRTDLYGTLRTTITNTTISGNRAEYGGGLHNFEGSSVVQNSTISGNMALTAGGGLSSFGDTYTSTEVVSTIVAGNTATTAGTADVELHSYGANNSFDSQSNNLIGDGNSLFTNGVSGNIVGSTAAPIDPLLGPLANNGGPVETMLLQAGSPAIDSGSNPLVLTNDARGGVRVSGAGTDIGAVELANSATSNNDILFGTPNGESINGLAGDDTIFGLAGNDVLIGNAGNDTTDGGTGNDIHFVNAAGDVVVERAGEGSNDRVAARVSYALSADAEIELFTTTSTGGTAAINLTGNRFAQTIAGNAGANVIADGGGAGDLLRGLAGNDTYIVRSKFTLIDEKAGNGSNDRVAASVDFALAADDHIERLTTTSTAGTSNIDLTGNARAQTITGNAGANVISDGGGTGADVLQGLAGNDTYIVRSKNTTINEKAGQGTNDRVAASFDFALAADDHVERLTTTSTAGTSGIDLVGNGFAQIITGNAGNNTLRSGTGAPDTLQGLGGNDIYRVFNAGDKIDEVAGKGTDRVVTVVDYVLGGGDSIELFTTSNTTGTSDIDLTGNGLSQTIIGNAGDNRIEGKRGADTLRGLDGNDTFIFKSALGNSNIDRIVDFNVAADQIEIDNAIFTAITQSGGTLRAGMFKANAAGVATDNGDRIIYDTTSGELYYDADGARSGAAQQFADLAGGLALTFNDFDVI